MGWEQRGNQSYYYKKEREGSTVKSILASLSIPSWNRIVSWPAVNWNLTTSFLHGGPLKRSRIFNLERDVESALSID